MKTMILDTRVRSLRLVLALSAGMIVLCATGTAVGQAAPALTKVMDTSALHPPKGASVAILEFSDLECPACAHANPVLKEAAAKYRIPWIRRDYVIQSHPWSKTAAVNARFFDTKGGGLGDAYRDAVFASQPSIYNVNVLAKFTQDFASSHGIALPFAIDPQGKLVELVQADVNLGQRVGIQHTPTIFIVYTGAKGDGYLEVENTDKDLYRTIDQALAVAKTAPVKTAATPVHHKAKN